MTTSDLLFYALVLVAALFLGVTIAGAYYVRRVKRRLARNRFRLFGAYKGFRGATSDLPNEENEKNPSADSEQGGAA